MFYEIESQKFRVNLNKEILIENMYYLPLGTSNFISALESLRTLDYFLKKWTIRGLFLLIFSLFSSNF